MTPIHHLMPKAGPVRALFAAGILMAVSPGYAPVALASPPELGLPQQISGAWMSRLVAPDMAAADLEGTVDVALSDDGFAVGGQPDAGKPVKGTTVSVHRAIAGIATGLSFRVEGLPPQGRLTLHDAAANLLWQSDGKSSQDVTLSDLRAIGEVVFRYQGPLKDGRPVTVSGLGITMGTLPAPAPDGFIETGSLAELRGYAHLDDVSVRLMPGTYRVQDSLYHHFIEVTGDGSRFDLSDVVLQADTALFSAFGVTPGEGGFYSVVDLTGDGVTWSGGHVQTYGDRPGIQPRNKIFNITGRDVTLRDATVTTAGSVPWGYGSLFGISGDPVRKMNGIRIGYPAERTALLGCTVHMRAMGHGIFVQGATDTLIDGCKVDGLLRPTDDILAEKKGFAFDRDFMIAGSGEGVPPSPEGRIPAGEMVSLSEDGIRLYPRGGPRDERARDTGRTVIRNSQVRNMRRGICTGFGTAANVIENSDVWHNVQAGFHIGSGDILVGSRADATYSEALIIPDNESRDARVALQITDSRGGGMNRMLAGINGTGHAITLWSAEDADVPDALDIRVGTSSGFLGRDEYGEEFPEGVARDIDLINLTRAKVVAR